MSDETEEFPGLEIKTPRKANPDAQPYGMTPETYQRRRCRAFAVEGRAYGERVYGTPWFVNETARKAATPPPTETTMHEEHTP